eukprot:scaffold1878_cov170-Amphora_coffeaeformis.AAC.12
MMRKMWRQLAVVAALTFVSVSAWTCSSRPNGQQLMKRPVAPPQPRAAVSTSTKLFSSRNSRLSFGGPAQNKSRRISKWRLFQSSLTPSGDQPEESSVEISPLVKATSKQLQRLSWFSWWAQMILTTVSTTILVFAASVVRSGGKNSNSAIAAPSFFLSGLAILLSAVSIIWTWGNGARLSKRLLRPTQLNTANQHIQAAKLVRRAVQVQVSINLLGLFGTLLAAEEIVGSLAIKVLTTFGVGASNMYNAPLMGLQPLDILVVQANTNSLFAQFISLATSLFLTEQIRSLDPPSTLEEPRKKKR